MSHEDYENCIQACLECATACEHCASACLAEPGVEKMVRCISLDWDCARICHVAASFMASGSTHSRQVCELCAEICRACGQECRRHSMDHCQECADACEQCARECDAMAGVKVH